MRAEPSCQSVTAFISECYVLRNRTFLFTGSRVVKEKDCLCSLNEITRDTTILLKNIYSIFCSNNIRKKIKISERKLIYDALNKALNTEDGEQINKISKIKELFLQM